MATGLLVTGLAGIGALVTLRVLYWAGQFLLYHLWRPSRPLTAYKRAGADSYALITGASAGIGLSIGRALVRQGFGVILLGHLPDELASAAKSLDSPNVRTLVLNARTATPAEIEEAVKSISDLNVSILVNNVGGIPIVDPPMRNLSTFTTAEVDAHVDLNARFMARLTNLMLPVLSSASKRRKDERSLILNLSSAGRVGIPWLVMYSATKAFNYAFTTALARELEDDPATAHIDCLAVVPGEVQSQSNVMAEGGPTSDVFGNAVVGGVDGAVRRKWRHISPYWAHDLQLTFADHLLPESMVTHFAREELRLKKSRWDVIMAKRR
jgi:17beta-estradiol 17-dehydrogenase / very-long-chain 3-oxoacyl-CoA reductase